MKAGLPADEVAQERDRIDTSALRSFCFSRAEVVMSLAHNRIQNDMRILLNLIRSASRFTACRARTAWLAKTLGWSEDRIEARLVRMEQRKLILRETTPPRWNGSEWTRARTIYLVSDATPAQGALMAAGLFRDWGRKAELRREAACGQLRCTPSQLDVWVRVAQEEKSIAVSHSEDGTEYVERIGNFPAANLPNRFCEDHWSRPEPTATLDERVLAFVRSRTQTSPPRPPTHDEVARQVGGSKSHVNQSIKNLVDTGMLFAYRRGRKHCVASDRATAEAEAARPDDNIAFALMALRRGPLTTRELALEMKLVVGKPLAASVRKRLHQHGVQFTRFGRDYIASIGPLPEQYRAERAQKQKSRKAEKGRDRRWCQKLGVQTGDRYLMDDIRLALGKVLFKEWQFRVGGPRLERLGRTAHEFAALVSENVLAMHIRMARAEHCIELLQPEKLAESVHTQVKDAFRPHALRICNGYDGPLLHAG
jgi:hypothetical protein